jgi:hypothetical protein
VADRPAAPGNIVTWRLALGLVMLAFGVLWTLDNLGLADASAILRWWPVLALTWGAMCALGVGCRRRPVLGGVWLVLGTVALLHNLHVVRLSLGDLFPLFLVGVGAATVARAWRGSRGGRGFGAGSTSAPPGAADVSSTRVNLFAFLNGVERRIVTQSFAGGEVSAVLGGMTADLRGAQLAGGHAVLDVFAMWGGVELIVPAGWRVVGRVSPLLGAYVDSMPPVTDPDAPKLEVRGLAVMGGVEVRSDDSRRTRLRRAIIGARFAPGIDVGVVGPLRHRDAPDPADAADKD